MKRVSEWALIAALQALLLTAAFVGGYWFHARTPVSLPWLDRLVTTRSAGYPLLDEVHGLLRSHYLGTLPDDQTLVHGAARGLVAAVNDPYTVFVEPQTHKLETHSLQGEYGGIGVELRHNEAGEVVLTPFRESPAAQAGVAEGDILLAVDGTLLEAGAALDRVAALVRGPIGSDVTVTVRQTDGTEAEFTIARQRYELPSVTWRRLPDQPHIGVIDIDRFSDRTPGEVAQALSELEASGAQQYVLDLRDNGGGLLDSAVEVAAYFLDGGVVMYETQRNAPEKTYTAPAVDSPGQTAPLAVLVNGSTASAAEIVAGALLDRGRAPLVGQTTFGKGSVQLVYDLSDGSSLHVTAYHWFTPARRELERVGLPPTFAVEPASDGTDAQLAYAVQYLTGLALNRPAAARPMSIQR